MNFLLLLPILIPVIAGLLIPFIKLEEGPRNIYILAFTFLTSICAVYVMSNYVNTPIYLVSINNIFSIGFNIDNLSKVFIMLLSILWPLTTIYAFEYMKSLKNTDSFFRYLLIAYGVALGIPLSANAITMYLFYEILTFVTLPLIMHEIEEKEVLYAGKVYLIASILGASMALIGIIILSQISGSLNFVFGGSIIKDSEFSKYMIPGYLLCFFGFSVKAAIFPFTFWLRRAYVAPTPVTALLHAVAVVKAGVFAVMRMTYYGYDVSMLNGTIAQYIPIIFAIFTIVYGSVMAIKAQNLKIRFAYSTASNLSYILLACLIMNNEGFASALAHMCSHALIKISIFFIVGALLVKYHIKTVDDAKGIASKMNLTCVCFVVASLGLIGIPLTCGFISKYYIIKALIGYDNTFTTIGSFAIVISSILTVIYTMTVIINMYFPGNGFDYEEIKDLKEIPNLMLIPIAIICIFIIVFGINSSSIYEFFKLVSSGI